MTKKLTEREKKERKPASRACVFCHSKHLQCSNERPCKNCVKRNIGDQCHDASRKRAKYLKDGTLAYRSSSATYKSSSPELSPTKNIKPEPASPLNKPLVDGFNQEQNILPQHPPVLDTTNDVVNKILYPDPLSDLISMANSTNSTNTPNHGVGNVFNSNYLNQEYLMLGDILLHSKPTSPSPSSTSISEQALNTVSPGKTLHGINQNQRPFISLGVANENKFVVNNEIMNRTTSDNTTTDDYVSPLISHHLYQTVQDIYSNKIINFEYPQSYHSLTKFLKTRFLGIQLPEEEKIQKRKNLLIILKLIASYRPTFISAHKSLLKPFDLQFLEMSFQRSLIDYENLSQLNSSPTIIWRRTGEIVLISNDLIGLLGFNLGDILSKRTFIMELMFDDESIVNYFKLFKSVAVGNLHSTIKTKCKLMKNGARPKQTDAASISDDYIEFCSVWTVKRDLFDLPMLIVGQFLPVLPAGDGVRMY